MSTASAVSRQGHFDVTDVGIRRDIQKILVIQGPQITSGTAHFVISGYSLMWQVVAIYIQHIQYQVMSGLIANVFWNAVPLSVSFIFSPLFRKIQTGIDQCVILTRRVPHINTHLAIVHFAEATQLLTFHAHRIVAAFFVSRRAKDNDTVFFA